MLHTLRFSASFALASALAACSHPPATPDATPVDAISDASDAVSETVTMPDVVDVPWMPPPSCLDAATTGPEPVSDAGDAGDAEIADVGADVSDALVTSDASVSVSGTAFAFTTSGGLIAGAYVTPFEHPERCVRTNADGYFRLDGFTPAEDVSLLMYDPRYPLIQTGTQTVPVNGMTLLAFQAPDYPMYQLLQTITRERARPDRCQIATTVTMTGFTGYDYGGPGNGEIGATVTITPDVPPESAPIYFQWLAPGMIIPDRTLTATSRDGGVLLLNVPPGDYVLDAHKTGVQFRSVRIRCRAGLLVNAAPPWGIQAL